MTMSDPNAAPRAALVTGGARRVGLAITHALVNAGYAVAVHVNTSRAEADAVCADIRSQGGRAQTVQADFSEHMQVLKLVPSAVAAVGPLTLLINNASMFEPDDIATFSRDLFDRHMAVHVRAPLFLAQAFAAQAPERADPSIVNMLDQRVMKPTPLFLSYALSKSTLYAATTMLAQGLAPRIRVNAIAPGPMLPSKRQSPEEFAKQTAKLPLGHGTNPEEIAQAVLFLAGARSVTGQTIAVDGGQRLAWQTPDVAGIEE
jgi:NAD(P)-dependent dehydrogenase (short-subunit alcohol dehydrogenase family)